ncbi:helix-turn-helix transcriptional regulator [Rhizobium leguminosarum]|uniref:helix-turn-helix transcriptional regulator n=1 Tax=Rhizobium leguminosarum TaxID=384 RepID=UPI001AE2BED3|nr:DNA-binding protein [Rhizobium leguminosarum]MBP2442860.1 putative DNA-binding transcriptional regulator AlpA [Rhizobium leguminosarum]
MQINDPLLSKREAAALLRVSAATFYRRIADGTVPKPLKIGTLSRWSLSDIQNTIEAAKVARNSVDG